MKKRVSVITLHMVSSLDGFIAKKDGDTSWLQSTDHYEKGITLSEEDMAAFTARIDCYVIGSHTYEHALELGWPYGNTPVVVLTTRALTTDGANVHFFSGDIATLVNDKLRPSYRNIWVAGGAVVVRDFLQKGFADEIIVSVVPVILGSGIHFFGDTGVEQRLHLKDVTTYHDGMVELHYAMVKG